MSKWMFTIEKTEDDHFTMFFFGKIPRGIMMMMLKAVAGVSAVMALVKQYFN